VNKYALKTPYHSVKKNLFFFTLDSKRIKRTIFVQFSLVLWSQKKRDRISAASSIQEGSSDVMK